MHKASLGARPSSLGSITACQRTTSLCKRPRIPGRPYRTPNRSAISISPSTSAQQPGPATGSNGTEPSNSSNNVTPSPSPAPPAAPSPAPDQQAATIAQTNGFQLKPIHMIIFSLIFVGGALFATMTLQFTAEMEFSVAVSTVLRRVVRSLAFRQLVVIACAILTLRYGMNNFLRTLSKFSSSPVQWDKTKLFYILREVYQPLELLLFIAAICTVSDAYVPSLIGVPRATVSHVVKSILSTSFILGFASVVFNLKSRFCKENAWQAEMKGDVTTQRRWEAYDKLGTFVIYVMTFVLGIQALGLEVTSVLAIGGIGGLAIGLAGREICENLLNGFLIMSTNPFEVGDEITFFHNNKLVDGFVIDIGWYRTNVRSFEREVYVIPNAVFSKNIVLNVSRKNREWRFYEMLSIRVQDVPKANAIVQDIRRIVRNDTRVINKLHRRVFLDKISTEDAKIYLSFYLEAANRDAFMAIKQDLLVSFVDCVERHGAKLATPRTVVDVDPEAAELVGNLTPLLQGLNMSPSMNMSMMGMSNGGNMSQGAPSDVTYMQRALPTAIGAANAAAAAVAMDMASGIAVSFNANGIPNGLANMQGPTIVQQVPMPPMDKQPPTTTTTTIIASPPSHSNGSSNGSNSHGVVKAVPVLVAPQSTSANAPSNNNPNNPSSSSSTANSNQPTNSTSGSRVGDIYTAPQQTVVVSVPVAGVPVAFAGSVSNNVVSASTVTVQPVNSNKTSSSASTTVSSSTRTSTGGSAVNGNNGTANTSSSSNTPNPSSSSASNASATSKANSSSNGTGGSSMSSSKEGTSSSSTTTGHGAPAAVNNNAATQQHNSPQTGGPIHKLLRSVAAIVFENQ